MQREVIDPQVKISIHGAAEDRQSAETRRVVDNGFNPRWDENFKFTVRQPLVAILAIQVFHVEASTLNRVKAGRVSKEHIASNAFPLMGLRQGMRWASLLDKNHQDIEHCGVLIHLRLPPSWSSLLTFHIDSTMSDSIRRGEPVLQPQPKHDPDTMEDDIVPCERVGIPADLMPQGENAITPRKPGYPLHL